MALIIPNNGLSVSPCRDFLIRCVILLFPLHQTQNGHTSCMLNPGSHHAFRDIRLNKKRRLWCAYQSTPELNTQNWKSKRRWTGPCPARQGKALPSFLVPVARELCGWQMSETVVFPGGVRNGRGGPDGRLGASLPYWGCRSGRADVGQGCVPFALLWFCPRA